MYNWSTDTKELEKNKKNHFIWEIEQKVNFGLNGEKIKEKDIRKSFSKINIDSDRLKFFKLLLEME